VGGNKLTDQALAILSSLPRLKVLDLSGQQRTDSGLWRVAITDKGMAHVALLRTLETLNLAGASVSAQGLRKLASLSMSAEPP
jgi:hypothetical protein